MSRRAAILLLAFVILAPLNCRKADGVQKDPVESEAEEAFVAYLKIDTTNPPGGETAGAKYLQQLLVKEGIEARLVGANPARQGVYARLKSNNTTEKALLLLSHIDVVPADAARWTNPPFAAVRSGGYIWGRGALDIKSLTIAQLMALVDLKRRNVPLKRDVVFLAVPDEEQGGLQGAGALLEQSPDLFDNVGFVLNEGGSTETVVDHVTVWAIETQQKVPLWLRITSEGMAGHAASPPDGSGAIAKLMRALTAIEKIETPYRLAPDVASAVAVAKKIRKDPGASKLAPITEPLDPAKLAALPPGYRNMLRDTIAITRINAGTSTNVIPATASADVDIRLLPDVQPMQMVARVRQAIGEDAELEVLLSGHATAATPTDTELYRVVSQAMQKAERNSTVIPIVGLGTSDSRFFRARGIPAYGIAPFKVNYYDADGIHGTDERIRARFFSDGVRLMRQIVRDFCEAK